MAGLGYWYWDVHTGGVDWSLCTNATHAMNDRGVIEVSCKDRYADAPLLGRPGEIAAGYIHARTAVTA